MCPCVSRAVLILSGVRLSPGTLDVLFQVVCVCVCVSVFAVQFVTVGHMLMDFVLLLKQLTARRTAI